MNIKHCQSCGRAFNRRSKFNRLGYCSRNCHRAANRGKARNVASELLAAPVDAADEAAKVEEIYWRAEQVRMVSERWNESPVREYRLGELVEPPDESD